MTCLVNIVLMTFSKLDMNPGRFFESYLPFQSISRVKAKNSIIKRIREEEDNNMNLRYLERHRDEQFLFFFIIFLIF